MPKILGVDDSQTMRRILEMTFAGDASSSINTVGDGDSAVRWAAENGADIVLADASMSGTDGYEVARALRANPATQNVAVIVLASQHHPYDAAKGSSCGVDDHMLKPFETQALLDKVRDVMGRPRAASAGGARPVAAAAPRPPAPVAPPSPPRPSPGVPGVVSPAAPAVQRPPHRATVAFGAPPGTRPPTAAPPAAAAVPVRPAAVPAPSAARAPALELADEDSFESVPPPAAAAPRPAAPAAVASATASNGEMAGKLSGLGLTPEQVDGVLALSREVIERVVWEVVPDLAETIIREEIRRLTSS